MSQLRAFCSSLPPDPNQGGDPNADGDPNAGDPNTGQPAAGSITADQAYQMGYADGQAGAQTQRAQVEQRAPGPTVVLARYDDGYRDGKAAAAAPPPPPPPPPPGEQPEQDDGHETAKEGLWEVASHVAGEVLEHAVPVLEGLAAPIGIAIGQLSSSTDNPYQATEWWFVCSCGAEGTHENTQDAAQEDLDQHAKDNPGHQPTMKDNRQIRD